MQENTMFNQDYDMNHLAHPGLLDPTDLLLKTLDEINDVFSRLNDMYDVSYGDFESFCQTNNPNYSQYLDALWSKVDTDIFDKYITQDLMNYEYKTWKKHLQQWRAEIVDAIKQFVWTELGQNFVPDVQMQHMIEAA